MKKYLALTALGAATLALGGCPDVENAAKKAGDTGAEIAADGADMLKNAANAAYTCPEGSVLGSADDYADGATLASDLTGDAAAWMAENAKRKDVNVTQSGLQYVVAQDGLADGAKPYGVPVVRANYHGYLINGAKFDSSYDRGQPLEFPVNRVIPGWVEAMRDMKVCEARILYIPSELAYGARSPSPAIPPNSPLIFKVQLLSVAE